MHALRLAYDGTEFHGYQRQPDVDTVEGALFRALAHLDITDGSPPPGYSAAGRTDAGVSALAQTIAVDGPSWLSPAAINGALPASIRVWAVADAPAEFHATRDAVSRVYTYFLHGPTLPRDRLATALARFEGTHDFGNFTPDDGRTERTVRSTAVSRMGETVVLRIRGDSFCRHQVRRMVSLVAAIGAGKREPSAVETLLGPEPVDGPAGVGPAPAEPLVLTAVEYPTLAFEPSPAAARGARSAFSRRRIELATKTKIMRAIQAGIGDTVRWRRIDSDR